ncbi:hypothetical protein SEVIR_1G356750v4 [Setaria viridis]
MGSMNLIDLVVLQGLDCLACLVNKCSDCLNLVNSSDFHLHLPLNRVEMGIDQKRLCKI